jgi:2-polyprenyl-6-methoxyphenol hydroxylase-like FAD-dependent oxidoreductase
MGLARQGHRVVVVERDGPPPPVPAEWDRRGVMQFLGPHMFRFIVRQKLLEVLPDVWEAMVAAGAVPVRPDGSPGEMTSLQSRRSTFEAAWWSSAASEPGLIMRRGTAQSVGTCGDRVRGVVVDRELIEADVVILATGRITRLGNQYRAKSEGGSCGFSYTARMYRARDGVDPPVGARPIASIYEGYGAAIFPQDDRTLTALFHRPTADTGLAGLRRVDAFEAAALQVPILAPWIDPARFVPITPVLSGSGLSNTYQSGLDDNGKATLAGLFFVGDALSTTNPSLGRGISLGLRQAAELVDLIARDGGDPRGAAEQFDSWCTQHIRPWYEDHVYADASLLARFRGEALDIDARLPSDVIVAAAQEDPAMMPVLVPFLAMATLPASLQDIEGAARAVLRTGWRPPYASGPSAPALAEVVSRSSRSPRLTS